ncbi:MAG: thioesterase family protein [Lewinella sp.]|nr:thioesterase family protein [Lewinella sp.]
MSRLTVSDFTVKITLPVQWGDMDAANHVNNAVYIRWVESARLAYFVEMGMDTTFRGADAGPILAWQDCKYIFPVTFPDTVTIGVRTLQVELDRFRMECGIFSEQHDRLVAIAKQVIVPYSFNKLHKVAMPEAWLAGIDRIEEG